MLLSRVLNALKKNGCEVRQSGMWMVAVKGTKQLHFSENGTGSGQVTHFTYRSPMTDASYDNFCDSYYSTIKAALGYLNGPEA